jgi:hypothetical protein
VQAVVQHGSTNPSQLVIRGQIGVVKHGAVQLRYGVLWNDRFEYYNSEQDFLDEAVPWCQIPLHDLVGFDAILNRFLIHLEERVVTVEISADDPLLQQWSEAWNGALHNDARAPSLQDEGTPRPSTEGGLYPHIVIHSEIGVVKLGAMQLRYGVLWTDRFEYYNSEQGFLGESLPWCQIPLHEFIGFEIASNRFLIRLDGRDITIEVSADGTLQQQWCEAWNNVGIRSTQIDPPASMLHHMSRPLQTGSRPSSLHMMMPRRASFGGTVYVAQGVARMTSGSETKKRFLAVTCEQIHVYRKIQDAARDYFPLRRIHGGEIRGVKVLDEGFSIGLRGPKDVNVHCDTQKDMDELLGAVQRLADDVEATKKTQKEAAAAKAAADALAAQRAADTLMDGFVMMDLGAGEELQLQYLRIYRGYLEYATNAAALEKRSERTRHTARDVKSVKQLFTISGFVIKLHVGSLIEMHVSDDTEERWKEAWQAFTGKIERRVALGDSTAYTYREFRDYFGDAEVDEQWNEATPVNGAIGESAVAPNAAGKKKEERGATPTSKTPKTS